MKQKSLAQLTYEGIKKRTNRQRFINKMEQLVSWELLIRLIELHYQKAGITRYWGLAKNAAQVFSLMALANLYHARVTCWRLQDSCVHNSSKTGKTPVWDGVKRK